MSKGSFASTRQTSTAARQPPAHAVWRLTAKRSRAVSTPSTMPKQDRYSALLPSIRRWCWRISVIDEKSNEIPAVQKMLEELDVSGHIVPLNPKHFQKKKSKTPTKPD